MSGFPPVFTSFTISVFSPMAAMARTIMNFDSVLNGANVLSGTPNAVHTVVIIDASTKNSMKNGNTDLSETPDTSKIYFATRTGDQFPGDSSLKFMTFQCSSADENQLRVAVYCNDETTFNALFPPYNFPGSGITNYEDAVAKLVSISCFSQDRIDKGTKAGSSTKYSTVLAENVTGFQIVPYKLENDEMKLETGATEIIYVPYMLELRLSVLSPEDFERWKTITDTTEKDNFRKQHEYTFTRSVFLGDRRAR